MTKSTANLYLFVREVEKQQVRYNQTSKGYIMNFDWSISIPKSTEPNQPLTCQLNFLQKIISVWIYFIFIFLIVTPQYVFAQQDKIDSLYSVLETSKSDTNKVKTLCFLSHALNDSKPDEGLIHAKQGLNLAQKLGYKKGQSICLNALALSYYQMGNFDSAMINFEKRFEIVQEMKDSIGIAGVYDNMGTIYIHRGELNKALDLREKANRIYATHNRKDLLASGYTWIGNIYKEQGEYSTALNYYQKTVQIYTELKDESLIGYPLINISSIFRNLKQYDQAKKYALEAKSKFDNSKNNKGVGVSLYRLALIYSEESDDNNAVFFLKEASKIFEQLKDAYFCTLVNLQLGNYYRNMRKNELALKYLDIALPIANKIDDKDLIASTLENIGAVYLDKKDYRNALNYMLKSEKIFIQIKNKESQLKLCSNFIEIYSHINLPDSAIIHFQKYKHLSDSLFNEQNSKSIAEMQTKYDTEKKVKEIEISAIKIEKQKSQMGLLTALSLVLLISVVSIYIQHRKKYQKVILLAKTNMEKNELLNSETKCRIRNTVSDKITKSILENLTNEIDTQKCYLDVDLNINVLALKLETNREYLSQIVNNYFGKNFNEYINYYRVQESIEILKKIVKGELENWTMDIVAEKSGFKHTSTFYPAFKAAMNVSPSEFKKALKNM